MKPRLELIIIDDFIPTWMQDRLEKLTQNHSIKYEFLSFTSHVDNINLNSEGDQFSNLILKDGQLKEYGADHFFLLPFLTACLKEGVIATTLIYDTFLVHSYHLQSRGLV